MKVFGKRKEEVSVVEVQYGVSLEENASELTQGNGTRFFEKDGGRLL